MFSPLLLILRAALVVPYCEFQGIMEWVLCMANNALTQLLYAVPAKTIQTSYVLGVRNSPPPATAVCHTSNKKIKKINISSCQCPLPSRRIHCERIALP